MLDVLKTLVAAVSCCRKGLFEVQESCQDYPSAVPRKLDAVLCSFKEYRDAYRRPCFVSHMRGVACSDLQDPKGESFR